MSSTHKKVCVAVLGAGILCGIACSSTIDPAAKEAFMASLGQTTMTVFPACVRAAEPDTYDADAATDIAAFLTTEGLADATASTDEVPITGPWHSNQLQMWQESAAALGAYVQANPITTEYALLAEYLILGTENVGGVHYYIVDSQGTLAYGILLNSHHSEFIDTDPQDTDDCTDLVIEMLGQLQSAD